MISRFYVVVNQPGQGYHDDPIYLTLKIIILFNHLQGHDNGLYT